MYRSSQEYFLPDCRFYFLLGLHTILHALGKAYFHSQNGKYIQATCGMGSDILGYKRIIYSFQVATCFLILVGIFG